MKDNLRPAPRLTQDQIEGLYVQASRNNDGYMLTPAELGFRNNTTPSPDSDWRCVQTATGSCAGCQIHEDLLKTRLRKSRDVSPSEVVDKFSKEWCPPGASAQTHLIKEEKVYLVNYKK